MANESRLRIFQVDAFTRAPFTGNPAAVVLGAQIHDDSTMREIAREYPHAEVAFVLPAVADDHDLRMRFFNSRKEMPFIGHATIAAHTVLIAQALRGYGVLTQGSEAGVLPVSARAMPDGASLIAFRQTPAELGPPLPLRTALRVAKALRLPSGELHDSMPACVARKGGGRLLMPVRGPDSLALAAPDADSLLSIGAELSVDGFFVFSFDRGSAPATSTARMFCPALGFLEDPVSGNAHALLAAYLWELGQLGEMSGFMGVQGTHIGRPGEVRVELEIDRDALKAIHIGGYAAIVAEGALLV